MNDPNSHTEQIERYLLNKMTEEEKAAFQFEIMQNPDLREKVAEMRQLLKLMIAEAEKRKRYN